MLSFCLNAQEGISNLHYNSSLFNQQKSFQFNKKSGAYNDIYIYKYDTLSLPFVDDFSKDKYTPTSLPGDANVTTDIHYKIEFSGVKDVSGNQYVDDTTYTVNISKNTDGDLIKDSIPNPVFKATIFDLSVYPPTSSNVDLWIDTTYIDSVFNTTSPDLKFAFSPDYVQDSLKVHTVGLLSNSTDYLWKDRTTWRNFTRGVNPPTIGVATFDGINEEGLSYNIANVNSYGLADELTSKALKMGSHLSADSLYLSFFYQYQGNGDSPEVEDSLVLQFWSPLENKWNSIWKTTSGSSSEFTQVMIPIKNPNYFVDGFQIRFQNYGTLSGAVDHWHLDYIYINTSRAYDDYNQPDLAFRYNITSLLNKYTSMPWEHYISNPSGFMGSNMTASFFNTNSITESFENHTLEVLYNGTSQTTIAGPAIVPDFLSQTEFTHSYDPKGAGYFFDPNVNTLNADFEVKSYFSHPGDFNTDNDTAVYTQSFYNYYGYDDNSPEGGYYVLADNVSIAQRFTSVIKDTLRAIQIHFEPVAFNAETEPFYLTIWESNNGVPGDVLFQNLALNKPSYIGFENDGFVEYGLESHIVLPAGDFFIGIQQTTKSRINIGFDINNDNSDRIYYNVGGSWFNTSLSGTLMMRAVFKSPLDKFILATEPQKDIVEFKKFNVDIYPNPFEGKIHIISDEQLQYNCFDLTGKLIQAGTCFNEIDFSNLVSGIYILKLRNLKGEVQTKKLIKH